MRELEPRCLCPFGITGSGARLQKQVGFTIIFRSLDMIEINEEVSKLAIEYLPAMIDEKKLRCWLLNVFCHLQAKCPHCGEMLEGKAQKKFLQLGRTRCRSCEKYIHFTQGTPLASARLTFEQFVFLAALAPSTSHLAHAHDLLGLGDNIKVCLAAKK